MLEAKSLDRPDETRRFNNGELAMVKLAGVSVGRATMRPGWKWSHDVKPLAGTDSCQESHQLYVLSGRMHVAMDDGTEGEAGAGDSVVISPGHDAWVVGDELFVAIDWAAADTYAKPAG
ncbi:uncharacterized protein DUF861 [Halopolyspora algeriensis]|uniref:Uncharacterized protein DUF861 n=1 Tax=Halopolyspora algeriensis TaxID=1500506 RepID=A0A368VNK3_9ACTN|nr:cupin domain-containing protein [Halopolyspora algeriensis]RCW43299.1 uncharacterized protein DUF861 [Halopolyspora algeriensis]TQM56358.1 uncharacterized protein DUF861 [Halopolyspora algeriensis]